MLEQIYIDGRPIGRNHSPYIIAEMSANHNGDINSAFNIIEAAKHAGASAVKLQTYKPSTITLDSDADEFVVKGGLWAGRTLYDLYGEAHTPWEWHKPLFEHARNLGITMFSSPFDNTAIDLLEDLNAPAYKIASFEAIDLPLIRYAASTGKPMIISTGMADADEIFEAVETARDAGCEQLVLLHCVSGYPAPPEDYNLMTLPDMMKRFGTLIGLSDHTLSSATAVGSVALGACLIEKHFTLDRNGGGPDDSFSLEPDEFAQLCRDAKETWSALGEINYSRKTSEESNLTFRRSLYFVNDLKAGDIIKDGDIRSVRPGFGLKPNQADVIIGRRVLKDVAWGQATSWDLISSDD